MNFPAIQCDRLHAARMILNLRVFTLQLNIESHHELRLLEVIGNKICDICRREKPLSELASYGQTTKLHRIEVVPPDQKEVFLMLVPATLLFHTICFY